MTAPSPADPQWQAAVAAAQEIVCGGPGAGGESIVAADLTAAIDALGARLLPPDTDTRTEPDLWQYGQPDPDEGPDAVMIFDGEPRYISPRYVRRPMRAVGPWVSVPTTKETPR